MTRLTISLLGPLQIVQDGEPVSGFKSGKVRALLAFLAVEANRPHRRETLSGLLWPDFSDRDALANLRQALYNLRCCLGDQEAAVPVLLVTRETLRFNPAADALVDVATFGRSLANLQEPVADVGPLRQALELYRGPFLEGFSIPDCPAFQEWNLLQRERFGRLMRRGLQALASHYERVGDYGPAEEALRRQLALEPWDERAHQRLMRILALAGQRPAALLHFEVCRRQLEEELGVGPSAETMALVEAIRQGKGPDQIPPALAGQPTLPTAEPASRKQRLEGHLLCVGRDGELAWLDTHLKQALAGGGQAVFVTGEAGAGKSTLIETFGQRAVDAYPELLVANAAGSAVGGLGDPYHLLREILSILTGDIEARRAAGAFSRVQAQRLWTAVPAAVQALVEEGPDLVGRLVPGQALVTRLEAFVPGARGSPWFGRLLELVAAGASEPAGLRQVDLFEQSSRVLRAIARRAPLLLLLDDLQWADDGSIGLLFHLGRELPASRILVVGAYRASDLRLSRAAGPQRRHPLAAVVHEFGRQEGAIRLDLDRCDGRAFVTALLDSEPNRLDEAFRRSLFAQTEGNPLFTVELLRDLAAQGDLSLDDAGFWVAGPALDWDRLPSRTESVIAEQIDRLPSEWQSLLAAASVQGHSFVAEVVAMVAGFDQETVVGLLSGPLTRDSRLVRPHSVRRLGQRQLSVYRFRHFLFGQYLYSRLDDIERSNLHARTGDALEALYSAAGDRAAVAARLAHHFIAAGMVDKAVDYLSQAGRQAYLLSANEEAIAFFERSRALIAEERAAAGRPPAADEPVWRSQAGQDSAPQELARQELARQELALLLALAAPLRSARGYATPELGRIYARAAELAEELGDQPRLFAALLLRHTFHYARAEYGACLDLDQRLAALAGQSPDQLAQAALAKGVVGYPLGQFQEAATALRRTRELEAHREEGPLVAPLSQNLALVSQIHEAPLLWFLGYPQQALLRIQEALALTQALNHAHSLAYTWSMGSCPVHFLRREAGQLLEQARHLQRLAAENGFVLFEAIGQFYEGWATVNLGHQKDGQQRMRRAWEAIHGTGQRMGTTMWLAALAEVHDDPDETFALAAQGLAFARETGERYYQAELHRLQGEGLVRRGDDPAQAEGHFLQALRVARLHRSPSLILRACLSLARLYQAQDRPDEARYLLRPAYESFAEGFGTADLEEARALLESLS